MNVLILSDGMVRVKNLVLYAQDFLKIHFNVILPSGSRPERGTPLRDGVTEWRPRATTEESPRS